MDKEEILQIAVTALPETTSSWVDIFSALLMPTIAGIALYIAYQQHQINKQRLKHETYEKRLKVYKAVQKHLSIIIRDGKTTYEECLEFYSEASEAAFLFDPTVMNKIDEIYKNSVALVLTYKQLLPSNSEAEDIDFGLITENNEDLLTWHTNQLEASRIFFTEKLGLTI